MKKLCCIILLLLLLFPVNTNAVYDVIDSRCTKEIKTTLREDAKDFAYRLSKSKNDEVTYTMYLYNLSDDIYIKTKDKKIKDTKIENLKPGSTFIIDFYANKNTYCSGYKITSKIINVPYYNKYSNNELCEGYENFSLCREDANINLSEEEFEKEINKYINSLKKEDKIDFEEKESEFYLVDFINEYIYFILIVVFLIISISISVVIIIKRKNRGIL